MRAESRNLLFKLLVGTTVVIAAACSLVVDFDPTGKPCSGDEQEQCLPGYICSEALVCIPKPPPVADGGVDGGLTDDDAGVTPDDDAGWDLDGGFPFDWADGGLPPFSLVDAGE